MMTGSFTNWKQYINRCYEYILPLLQKSPLSQLINERYTNPGGYCELQDVCLPVRCDDDTLFNTTLEKWGNLLLEGSLKLGVGLDIALTTKAFMEEAGFEDVSEVIYKWPMNRWPANKEMKEIGTFPYFYFTLFLNWQVASSLCIELY